MTQQEQSGNLIWYWNSKPFKLKHLHHNQLDCIKKLLLKSNTKWYGQTTEYWLNAIKQVEKPINKKNTNEATDLIISNRIKQCTLKANYLTNMIIKANNKTIK